jgi:hypothetical protein
VIDIVENRIWYCSVWYVNINGIIKRAIKKILVQNHSVFHFVCKRIRNNKMNVKKMVKKKIIVRISNVNIVGLYNNKRARNKEKR